jgi:tRNA 2-thiocytidine biosynthesis protein TtcA
MLYGAQIQAMLPRLKSTNFEGMELIRPMYKINEEAVLEWRDYNKLDFLRCACKITKKVEEERGVSKRAETKALIKELKKTNPLVERNIFNAIHNVQLDTLVRYKTKNKECSFLDRLE